MTNEIQATVMIKNLNAPSGVRSVGYQQTLVTTLQAVVCISQLYAYSPE